jgi:hypothetical protein
MPENTVFSAGDQAQPAPQTAEGGQAPQDNISAQSIPSAFSAVAPEPQQVPLDAAAPAEPEASPQEPQSPPPVRQNLALVVKFPGLPILVLLAALLAVVRFWQPADYFNWVFQILLFVVGAVLGQILFLFEPYFGKAANSIGSSLANNRLTSDLPEIPRQSTSLTDTSPLKQSLILFLLPIVGVFLLSSSRWPLGLGFLLGVSWVYFWDILAFLRNGESEFPKEYFPPQQAESRSVQTALIWYMLYMAILAVGLILI